MEIAIRNIEPGQQEFMQLGVEIRETIKIIGIRDPLPDPDIAYFCEFTIKYFPWLKLGEFRHAFEQYASGKLYGDNPGHFQSFDIIFIGQVLNKYKNHQDIFNTPMYQGVLRKSENTLPEHKPQTSDKDYWDKLQEFIQRAEMPTAFPWAKAYYYAMEQGIIQFEDGEREAFLNAVRSDLRKISRSYDIDAELAKKTLENKKLLGLECASRYMEQWTKEQIENQ